MTSPLLVLHAWGDPRGSSRWRGLEDAWDGPVVRFDLPGHCRAPAPMGGSYSAADAALHGDRAVRDAGLAGSPVVVLGDSSAGLGAELLAAAGRVAALVLVDGLGGPWCTAAEVLADEVRWCNAVFADPAAQAPLSEACDLDPRLRHELPTVWERSFTEARRAAISVPVLAIETPSSQTPLEDRDARLASFAGRVRRVDVASRTAGAIAPVLGAHRTFLTGGTSAEDS